MLSATKKTNSQLASIMNLGVETELFQENQYVIKLTHHFCETLIMHDRIQTTYNRFNVLDWLFYRHTSERKKEKNVFTMETSGMFLQFFSYFNNLWRRHLVFPLYIWILFHFVCRVVCFITNTKFCSVYFVPSTNSSPIWFSRLSCGVYCICRRDFLFCQFIIEWFINRLCCKPHYHYLFKF